MLQPILCFIRNKKQQKVNTMSTQLNQMENNLPTTTSKQEFVSPTHDHIIPKRMKKANLFVKSFGVLALVLTTVMG
jgi:hypothetical protein